MMRIHARFLSSLAARCSTCSHSLPTALPACSQCGSISPVPPTTAHHDLFNLPISPNPFVIDQTLLKRRFREAQAACHPDSWTSKGQHKQDIAQGLSSRLNEAYQTLSNPLRRAEYLLEKQGMPISEHETLEDIDFITEIMQTREDIEEAEDSTALSLVADQNRATIDRTVEELASAVGSGSWDKVKEEAVRLKYLESIDVAAKQKAEEIGS